MLDDYSDDERLRMNRRAAVMRMGAGLGGLAFATMLGGRASSAHAATPATFDLTPKSPSHQPRAKAVIQLFMHGGPSHVDLLDPKPELTRRDADLLYGRQILNDFALT